MTISAKLSPLFFTFSLQLSTDFKMVPAVRFRHDDALLRHQERVSQGYVIQSVHAPKERDYRTGKPLIPPQLVTGLLCPVSRQSEKIYIPVGQVFFPPLLDLLTGPPSPISKIKAPYCYAPSRDLMGSSHGISLILSQVKRPAQ